MDILSEAQAQAELDQALRELAHGVAHELRHEAIVIEHS